MRSLVIGFGSIGARHAGVLSKLGHDVGVVSRHASDAPYPCYTKLYHALAAQAPDYVVIANETALHRSSLIELAELGFTGQVLIEKPLFDSPAELPILPFSSCHVAYNLRFHPVIKRLREKLQGERCLSVMAYAGQYLPEWRPGTNYRQSYSANANLGGGVLRDLSHELDYLTLLFGSCTQIFASGGHLSKLQINSDDLFALHMIYQDCAVAQLQINYLDHPGRRFIIINTTERTFVADLVRNELVINGDFESFHVPRDETYRLMHEEILNGTTNACSLTEGQGVLQLIAAAELSAESGAIVNL